MLGEQTQLLNNCTGVLLIHFVLLKRVAGAAVSPALHPL